MNKTGIEYLDYTWNPVTGCSPVGAGCENCWARRMATRLAGRCGYPSGDPFRVTFHPERLDEPLKLRAPARIGVCFMGDLFHDDVDPGWVDQVLEVIGACPQHRFFILTKRPYNADQFCFHGKDNLWPGVSVWDQDSAALRIPHLLRTEAAHRWVSYEPALGPVDFGRFLNHCHAGRDGECSWEHCPQIRDNEPERSGRSCPYEDWGDEEIEHPRLDWIVMGGETGPRARPMHPDWARSVRDQCAAAGVPFFLKQLGMWGPVDHPVDALSRKTGDFITIQSGCAFKKHSVSTRVLDGRTHDEVPE